MSLSNPNSLVTEQRLKEFYDEIFHYIDPYKKVLSETLAAGDTSVTFTGLPSGSDYLVDFYTTNGANYSSMEQVGNTVTLFFDAQVDDITVFCEITPTLTSPSILDIKDAYKAKVFGDMTGLIYGNVEPTLDRTEDVTGRWVVDTQTTTVWVYAEFTSIVRLSGDWYATVSLTGFNASLYLPQYKSTTRENAILTTDSSSTIPTNSFFVQSSGNISVHKGDIVNVDEHYIVYGSWQY